MVYALEEPGKSPSPRADTRDRFVLRGQLGTCRLDPGHSSFRKEKGWRSLGGMEINKGPSSTGLKRGLVRVDRRECCC